MATEVTSQAELTAALAAMGAGEEIQLHAGTYTTPAAGNVVPAGGVGGLIRPYPGDEGLVICTASASGDTWRVHGAVEIRDIISEATGGNDCYSLNTAGCTLTRVTGRNYTSRCVYSTTDGQTLDGVRCDGATADTAIELTGASNVVKNCVVYGVHVNGIRAKGSVFHPTILGCTGRALECDQAVGVRSGLVASNSGVALYLNNASADVDYVHLHDNGTDSQVVAGTLGAHLPTGDPLFVAPGSDDYQLQAGSPCLDVAYDTLITTDANGDTRPVAGGPDYGAYERQTVQPQVISARADGLGAIVVTFDQDMETGGDTADAALWTLEAVVSGTVPVIAEATQPAADTVRLALASSLDPATVYRITAPATAENASGDVIDPAADSADFVTGLFVPTERTDLWAFLADATVEQSDRRLPFLHQAVLLALFADARATAEDGDPLADGNPRGWLGDWFRAPGAPVVGSRLWTLSRARLTDEVARRARDFAADALRSLVSDGLCTSVEVETAIEPRAAGGRRLALVVRTYRGDKADVELRFADLWEVFRG